MTAASKSLGIVLLLCCGATSAAVHAQAPTAAQPPVRQMNGTVVVEDLEPGAPPTRRRPFLNSHGMGCASSLHELGCGNFCSNFTFMFGSCRTFFGQTCTPDAPHFGPDSRHGQAGDGSRRCCGK
jgi:hypothetical protein